MNERPSSMVFLVPGFPADEGDASCVPAVQNYVAAYARQHPEQQVHVITFQYPFRRGAYRWKGATVHALGGRNRRGLGRLVTWIRALGCLARLYRRTEIVGLHSFWLTECAAVAAGASHLFGLWHVASIAGQDARADNPYLKLLPLRRMVVTAGSAFAAETFRASTGCTVQQVVPLGLDVEALQQIPPPSVRDIDIIGVGALTPVKNYRAFLDLVAQLVPVFPQLRAVLVGDGPERARLERLVADKHVEAHVELVGHLPRVEVFALMQRSKILLHVSGYEGQGYVFLEAQLAGLQVVCHPVGYAGSGPAVHTCHTRHQMRQVLQQLLRQPSPASALAIPSVEATVQTFEDMYRRLGRA